MEYFKIWVDSSDEEKISGLKINDLSSSSWELAEEDTYAFPKISHPIQFNIKKFNSSLYILNRLQYYVP